MLHLEPNVTSEKLPQTVAPAPQFVEGGAVLKLRSNLALSTLGHKFAKISKHR